MFQIYVTSTSLPTFTVNMKRFTSDSLNQTPFMLLRKFIKKLKSLLDNTDTYNQNILYYKLINKYVYLYSITIICTLLVYVTQVILTVTLHLEFLSNFAVFLLGFDSTINGYCIYYSMGFAKNKYNNNCIKCQNICIKYCCCIKTIHQNI